MYGGGNTYKIMVGKLEETPESLRRRMKDNIKMNLIEIR
jgi:hypothetical protein